MSEMQPGRELDALIAEKVMGWKLDYEFADQLDGPVVPELRDQYDEWGILPGFSTDVGDAWLIVEKMTEIPNEGPPINTVFAQWFDRAALWSMSQQEAATAICRAALAVIGVTRE